MIDHLMRSCDFCTQEPPVDHLLRELDKKDSKTIARLISVAENFPEEREVLHANVQKMCKQPVPVLGITGTGGAGKSSLVDELVRRFLRANTEERIAIISVDPSKRKTGGALLGDRIRMNSIHHPHVYMLMELLPIFFLIKLFCFVLVKILNKANACINTIYQPIKVNINFFIFR